MACPRYLTPFLHFSQGVVHHFKILIALSSQSLSQHCFLVVSHVRQYRMLSDPDANSIQVLVFTVPNTQFLFDGYL